MTFFLLLAIFPALAAFVSLYGIFLDLGLGGAAADAARGHPSARRGRPDRRPDGPPGDPAVATLEAAFAVSTLISVWSANAGMKALFDGLNIAYGETEKRPYCSAP